MAMSVSAPTIAVPVAPALPEIPIREILPWAVFAVAACSVLLYFVGVEQGALSVIPGMWVHEFVHDARHLAGLPCH